MITSKDIQIELEEIVEGQMSVSASVFIKSMKVISVLQPDFENVSKSAAITCSKRIWEVLYGDIAVEISRARHLLSHLMLSSRFLEDVQQRMEAMDILQKLEIRCSSVQPQNKDACREVQTKPLISKSVEQRLDTPLPL